MNAAKEEVQECIFILESPSAEDLVQGRREGEALFSALKLSGVPTEYFHIANARILEDTLLHIAKHPKSMKRLSGNGTLLESKLFVPILHFSFHANDQGLGLASDELIPWADFAGMLRRFNDAYGWLKPGRSMVSISVSACSGFALADHIPVDAATPFAWLLGFPFPVSWSDALVAFVSYYHLLIHKNVNGREALKPANEAAGLPANTLRAMNWERKTTCDIQTT